MHSSVSRQFSGVWRLHGLLRIFFNALALESAPANTVRMKKSMNMEDVDTETALKVVGITAAASIQDIRDQID